jgi:hypothetical protein
MSRPVQGQSYIDDVGGSRGVIKYFLEQNIKWCERSRAAQKFMVCVRVWVRAAAVTVAFTVALPIVFIKTEFIIGKVQQILVWVRWNECVES